MKRLLLATLALALLAAGPAAAEGFLPTKKTMHELVGGGFAIVATTTVPNSTVPEEQTLVFTLVRGTEVYLCRFKLLPADAPFGHTRCFELRAE
jgi:hypothetical protein